MPFYFNLLISFALGALWVERLKRRPELFRAGLLSFPLIGHIVFQLIVLTPIQVFQFRFHHDWSLGYLIDPELHPEVDEYLAIWSFLAALLLVGVGVLGHLVGRLPFDKPKTPAVRYAHAACAVLALAIGGILFREWWWIGTFDEFFAGEARFLLRTPTGLVGIAELAACGAFLHLGPRIYSYLPSESSDLS